MTTSALFSTYYTPHLMIEREDRHGDHGNSAKQRRRSWRGFITIGMNDLEIIYDMLHARYGNLNWWPAKSPYEVIVGAVLTQNTSWSNVERAIANFKERLFPETILDIRHDELADLIRSAGFFNQKAAYLKEVTKWYAGYGFDVPAVRRDPIEKLRPELLNVKGIGRETADSILLYAFGFPTFVVDAYTIRLCDRFPIKAGKGYDAVKSHFEKTVEKDTGIYNNYHALIVINGKNHCKKKPMCNGCPLIGKCQQKA